MSVVQDILRSWRHPRQVVAEKLGQGPREDRALAMVIGASALAFVAQTPGLSRAAHLQPEVPLDARMGGALMASLFLLPLILYAVAGISHLLARAFGGKGSGFGARLALFWAFLCATPLMLLQGLVAGFIGPGPALVSTSLIAGAGFLALWMIMLTTVERG